MMLLGFLMGNGLHQQAQIIPYRFGMPSRRTTSRPSQVLLLYGQWLSRLMATLSLLQARMALCRSGKFLPRCTSIHTPAISMLGVYGAWPFHLMESGSPPEIVRE